MATDLSVLPESFGIDFFGDEALSKRSKERGYCFSHEGYVHRITLHAEHTEVSAKARCYRSMRKSETPHTLNLIIDRELRLSTCSLLMCSWVSTLLD